MKTLLRFFPGLKLAMLVLLFCAPLFGEAQSALNNSNQPVFNHFALCAKNLRKTADFYSSVLQLQKIHHPFNDTLHVWFKIGPGTALHVIQGDCSADRHDIAIHLSYTVPDFGAFVKRLDRLNIKFGNWTGEPKKVQLRADNVRQIYFQDPDGFWIEVNDAK